MFQALAISSTTFMTKHFLNQAVNWAADVKNWLLLMRSVAMLEIYEQVVHEIFNLKCRV